MIQNKTILKALIFLPLLLLFLLPNNAQAADPVEVYFFYSQVCPHCSKEEVYLDKLEVEYGDKLNVNRYEIYYNNDNRLIFDKFAEAYNRDISGVPATFVGEQVIVGYGSDDTTGQTIKNIIEQCGQTACPDIGRRVIQGETGLLIDKSNSKEIDESSLVVDVPFFGTIDLRNYSLFGLTIVVGGLDGFNPCAMWVLVFLISILLGMQNRRRMWTLGLTFIAASAIVYFIFLAAWFNLFRFIGILRPVQVIIGLAALGVGVYYLRRFWKMRPGVCEVTNPEQRQKLMAKIKRVISERALWLALLGIIGLAFTVNLIELACSAGLPAIYTQVLVLSNLPGWQYYLYLLLYIFIFMLDDMIIFAIAMATLKVAGGSGKYSRYATLVGGVVILLLGVLMIVKPEWLALV
ncbi:MAG: hypothetical protein V1838_05100 [Patescibacteria group bacterium]